MWHWRLKASKEGLVHIQGSSLKYCKAIFRMFKGTVFSISSGVFPVMLGAFFGTKIHLNKKSVVRVNGNFPPWISHNYVEICPWPSRLSRKETNCHFSALIQVCGRTHAQFGLERPEWAFIHSQSKSHFLSWETILEIINDPSVTLTRFFGLTFRIRGCIGNLLKCIQKRTQYQNRGSEKERRHHYLQDYRSGGRSSRWIEIWRSSCPTKAGNSIIRLGCHFKSGSSKVLFINSNPA